MFGLSWGQIGIIVLVGVFVLGPERIPTAVRFVSEGMTKARTMLAGAQSSLHAELGPELDELRRQIAELQELKGLVNLQELRDLHPQRLLGKTLMPDSTGGGLSAWLSAAPTASTPAERVDLVKHAPTPAPTNEAAPEIPDSPDAGGNLPGGLPDDAPRIAAADPTS